MYPSYMNKPAFMTNPPNTSFGASTSTFGQPAANTSMFSSMQPSNIFQTPSTSTFNAGPTTQSSFGTNLFGQQPQPSTSGLFGSTSNAFGQNKTAFGFGSTPAQTGLFGQAPQQQAGASLFQSNSANLFGSSAFGNQTTGTVIKFSPVTGTDTMQKNGVTQSISTKHHCITCMKEYESKSLEELRFEDYSCNRKGPQQQPGFGATPFGASTTGASSSLFGQTENKQTFGQPQAFGQTPAFGQTTSAFGVGNQAAAPTLFGKPNTFGATTSTTPSFGFNAAPSTSNPFSATQTQKPFSQPLFGAATTQAQPSFGAGVFGQTNTQNTGANLFQKPAQPTTGFNTAQPGFSFNQTGTTQASNLFQVSKPNTGFGIFGQTTTTPAFGQTSQSAFGTNFGKLTQSTFSQPTQPSFGTNLTSGLQQPSLFGNAAAKPPSLFGTATTGNSLFNNNVFQQTPNNFSLNMNQPQTTQFPPESDESKGFSLLATDSFPDGPHIYGLEPRLGDTNASVTNPKDIKLLLDYSRKRDETLGTKTKVKIHAPKPKRGNNYNKEFFETNQALKGSHKRLVIRKFNDNNGNSTIYNKYKNELLEEAEDCLRRASETPRGDIVIPPLSIDSDTSIAKTIEFSETLSDYKARITNLRRQFDQCSDYTIESNSNRTSEDSFAPSASSSKWTITDSATVIKPPSGSKLTDTFNILSEDEIAALDTERDSPAATHRSETEDNPAGVVLTKPEYYMYPALKDLHQYMNENGECIVQGFTIGRRGYGNVYFPDPIDISNTILDEIVHFRHREVIIYPDDTKKPPIGEGLNRKAQVTLDKIYPREKGTNNYITDVNQIMQTNFVDNLMHITQKHNSKFVDYRPKTGSWVFKVKHFSKYSFTDSDEEECEVTSENIGTKKQEMLQRIEEEESVLGLGGKLQPPATSTMLKEQESTIADPTSVDLFPEDSYMLYLSGDMYPADSAIQTLKSSLFTNLDTDPTQMPEKSVTVHGKKHLRSEVIAMPRVHRLPNLSLLIQPTKTTSTQRCYTELGVFRCNTYKVGWGKGFDFFISNPVADNEVVYTIEHCNINVDNSAHYNTMMPNLSEMLQITLEESSFTFDGNKIPTLNIKQELSYLEKQTNLFRNHAMKNSLTSREKYLASVWSLCSALWGPGDNNECIRRQNVSDWLEKFAFDLSDELSIHDCHNLNDSEVFKTIFRFLTSYRIPEACEFAAENNLNRLSLLISQLSANERYKDWLKQYTSTYLWQVENLILDEFKKLYLLLAGIPVHEDINTCENLDWLRSFGLHLWYIAPAAAPIHVAFNLYKSAFQEKYYANKPMPPYCDAESQTNEFDLLYHILAIYVDSTYQLCKVLHPETHTENVMDYRLSWFLLQLFLSLNVGLIRDSEKEHLHTTFSTQLENAGEWKWAIFTLLFLNNNTLKKNLIMKILDRNIASSNETGEIEKELVQKFKIPSSWIHEVKATKCKAVGSYYDYFQHCMFIENLNEANTAFVDHILPELFVNEQYDCLKKFLMKLEPYSERFIDWHSQGGLFQEYFELKDSSLLTSGEDSHSIFTGKLVTLLTRINSFPIKNDQQKLCVAELSRKCALMFLVIHRNVNNDTFRTELLNLLSTLIMPLDIKHYELFNLIADFLKDKVAVPAIIA